jgi:ABC-type nitrate/sulfonate/bicarbonate transport system permease component
MFLSGYVIAFVIGVAVGFVFSTVILFNRYLEQIP